MTFDVAIIGAGPAGASAAVAAAERGLSVLLLDENDRVGGQVWRVRYDGSGEPDGAAMRQAVSEARIDYRPGTRVWHLDRNERGFTIAYLDATAANTTAARALILAHGASERVLPVPGWTLPGVVGLAGATALIKGQGVAPGHAAVVAGSGPLLYAAAVALLDHGTHVAAIVDTAGLSDWIAAFPALARRPRLFAKGAAWMARVGRARIPIFRSHAVVRIDGGLQAASATIAPVDRAHRINSQQQRTIDCDCVLLGNGLLPVIEPAVLLGAATRFDDATGAWQIDTDTTGRTSIAGLFAVGDGASIEGADAAIWRGRIAAAAISQDDGAIATMQIKRNRAARLGLRMATLAHTQTNAAENATPDTIVCRCEGVTRAMIDDAVIQGNMGLGAVKGATRAGMGPCSGRYCSNAIAHLVAAASNSAVADLVPGIVRPPLRPVPLAALVAGFDYADLPPMKPSPL
jgi:thioredoxin reductase/bacterioferritin-associated ferredoxin